MNGAAANGLWSCRACARLLAAPSRADSVLRCPRCRQPVRGRKRDGIARTWALSLAAAILFVPAMVLPIMRTTSLGGSSDDTILSGIWFLFESGQAPIALLVFVASVVVPVAKLVALWLLLVSVQRRWRRNPRQRTALYRVVEWIGRWSMLDIFVVTLLVALVHLGNLATIEPRAGAVSFAAVVVLTMFAARSFDPRTIWDALDPAGARA